MGDMSLPSKLTSYLSAGRAVLAAVAPDGATALELDRTGGAAVTVSPGDPEPMAAALVALKDDPRPRGGGHGRRRPRLRAGRAGRPAAAARLDELLEECLTPHDHATHPGAGRPGCPPRPPSQPPSNSSDHSPTAPARTLQRSPGPATTRAARIVAGGLVRDDERRLHEVVVPGATAPGRCCARSVRRSASGCCIRHRVRVQWPWKLSIGDDCWIGEGVWLLNLEPITVEHDVCLSQEAFICTGCHRHRDPAFEFDNGPIAIGAGAWVAARATVLRGLHRSMPVRWWPPGRSVRGVKAGPA